MIEMRVQKSDVGCGGAKEVTFRSLTDVSGSPDRRSYRPRSPSSLAPWSPILSSLSSSLSTSYTRCLQLSSYTSEDEASDNAPNTPSALSMRAPALGSRDSRTWTRLRSPPSQDWVGRQRRSARLLSGNAGSGYAMRTAYLRACWTSRATSSALLLGKLAGGHDS